jgi:Ca2+-binding EF-hand superfamily protein
MHLPIHPSLNRPRYGKDVSSDLKSNTSPWIPYHINIELINSTTTTTSNSSQAICQVDLPLHTTLAAVRRHIDQKHLHQLQGVDFAFVAGDRDVTHQDEQYCALDLFSPGDVSPTELPQSSSLHVCIRHRNSGKPSQTECATINRCIETLRASVKSGATKTVPLRDLATLPKAKDADTDDDLRKVFDDMNLPSFAVASTKGGTSKVASADNHKWSVGETAIHRPSATKVEVIKLKHGGSMLALVALKDPLDLCQVGSLQNPSLNICVTYRPTEHQLLVHATSVINQYPMLLLIHCCQQLLVEADEDMTGSIDKGSLRSIVLRKALVSLSESDLDVLMHHFKSPTDSKQLCWRSFMTAIDPTALTPSVTQQTLFWKRIHQNAYGGVGTCQHLRVHFQGEPPNGQISPLAFESSIRKVLGFDKTKRADVWNLYTSLDHACNCGVTQSSLIVEYEAKCCDLPWRPTADLVRAFSGRMLELVGQKVKEMDAEKKKAQKMHQVGIFPWATSGMGSLSSNARVNNTAEGGGENTSLSNEENAVLALLREDRNANSARKNLERFTRDHVRQGLLTHNAFNELQFHPIEVNMLFDAMLSVVQAHDSGSQVNRHEVLPVDKQTVTAKSVWAFVQLQRRDRRDLAQLCALLREQIMKKWYNNEDFRDIFRQFDPEGTGFISSAQFRRAFESLGARAGCSLHLTEEDAQRILNKFEATNGQVRYRGFLKFVSPLETQEEIVSAIRAQLKCKSFGGLKLRSVFKQLAQNGRDQLNMSQLLHGLQMLGVPTAHLTDVERHAVIDAVDWSGDGQISFSKFARFVLGSAQAAAECVRADRNNEGGGDQTMNAAAPSPGCGEENYAQSKNQQQNEEWQVQDSVKRNVQVAQYLNHNRFY